MTNDIRVTKRDGTIEPLDYDKINTILEYACDGISDVSPSLIAMNMVIKFYDKISTKDIHDVAIKSAADLISEECPNYQYVASRLLNYKIRKDVYGQLEPIKFLDHIKKVIDLGFYDPDILNHYTDDEINKINKHIKHSNDDLFTYAGMKLFEDKYLVRDKRTNTLLESPQFAYMLLSMTLFANETKDDRMQYVVDYYGLISTGKKSVISLPSPLIAGVRTKTRQFSSCTVIKTGDSLESIDATGSAILSYTSRRAGIGLDVSELRSVGSPIRHGEVSHTGLVPFIKKFESDVKSCNQGGLRNASATLTYCIWHPEIEDLLVLKNNKGSADNRARNLDYSVQINGHFYKKAIAREDYCLFNPNDVPALYEAFFSDQAQFEKLYDKFSKSKKVKKRVNAFDLLVSIVNERLGTGRIYITNVDTVNKQSSFLSNVYSSNLCQEISLPTENIKQIGALNGATAKKYGIYKDDTPMEEFQDQFGEVALCTLSAINWDRITKPSDFEKPMRLAVRALDNLLSYQDYPIISAEIPAKSRRALGIGIINFAHFLAKNGVKYGENLELVDEYMEAMYFYAVRASVDLAKERGHCLWSNDTKYHKGIFAFDNRTLFVDTLVPHNPKQDWETLRKDATTYGIRNSTLIALLPSETSSIISNATNGIEPPRSIVTVKSSKQVVPNIKLKYDYLWSQPNPTGYINTLAVLQKYTDQAISTNLSYNPENFEDGKIPLSQLVKDILYYYKTGGKNIYYMNQREIKIKEQNHNEEESCESCKI